MDSQNSVIVIGEEIKIEVKQPNRQHMEKYFQKTSTNIMLANRNLLIDIAVEPKKVTELLDNEPIIAMSCASALADLVGIKQSFLQRGVIPTNQK